MSSTGLSSLTTRAPESPTKLQQQLQSSCLYDIRKSLRESRNNDVTFNSFLESNINAINDVRKIQYMHSNDRKPVYKIKYCKQYKKQIKQNADRLEQNIIKMETNKMRIEQHKQICNNFIDEVDAHILRLN